MPTSSLYLFNLIAIFCPNSHVFITSIWSDHIRLRVTACVVEMPALLATAADFCQRLSLNTSHIMFWGSDSCLVPKGCSPTTNGTGCGGDGGMRMGWGGLRSSTFCRLFTSNKINIEIIFALKSVMTRSSADEYGSCMDCMHFLGQSEEGSA